MLSVDVEPTILQHLSNSHPEYPHTPKSLSLHFSVLLDSKSLPLTTFITEWGRYMYLRMPQGFFAAGDAYTRCYDKII